jgi:hypothetical protein
MVIFAELMAILFQFGVTAGYEVRTTEVVALEADTTRMIARWCLTS